MEIRDNGSRLELALPAVLDLPAAAELRDLLIDALSRDTSAEIVLLAGGVERVSTACIQVVLAAIPAFKASARRLEVEEPAEAFANAFSHLGLAAAFNDLLHA